MMLQPVNNGARPLGSVWIDAHYSVMSIGLGRSLKEQAGVHIGHEAPRDPPSCVVLCTDTVAGLSEGVKRVREASPGVPILIFGMHIDLPLARDALRLGARGFIHAGMRPEQVVRAIKVAIEGELVAPRELLQYLIVYEDPVDLNILSARQREILDFVVEGMSNAQIANRLYLSESTIKQHLRAAYKLLGVKNRTEAARLIRSGE